MSAILSPEDVRRPYASKDRFGVMWWCAHIGILLGNVLADVITVWLVWKYTDNLSGGFEQIFDVLTGSPEALFWFLGALYAVIGMHFVWKAVMRSLMRKACDSIPGVYGVVKVEQLPGLGWGDFWVFYAPRVVLSTAFLITICLLGASPIIVGLALTTYTLQACRHGYISTEDYFATRGGNGTHALAFSVILMLIVIIQMTSYLNYEGAMTWFVFMATMAVVSLLGFSWKTASASAQAKRRDLGGTHYSLKRPSGVARMRESS